MLKVSFQTTRLDWFSPNLHTFLSGAAGLDFRKDKLPDHSETGNYSAVCMIMALGFRSVWGH